ncbi:MAG: hypothetical protein OXH75_28765 [Acidobacteria bacterium]|nr:hypothetical protein [Acidobacteriota bacterium]
MTHRLVLAIAAVLAANALADDVTLVDIAGEYVSGDCPDADYGVSISGSLTVERENLDAHAAGRQAPSGLACDRQGVTVDYGMAYRFAAGFGLDAVVNASYDKHSQPAEYLDSDGGSHFYNVGAPATAFGFGLSREFGGTDETDGLRITVALNLLPDDYGDWTASASYDLDVFGGRITVNASTLAGNRSQASAVFRRDVFHVGVSRETGRNFVPVPLTQADGAHVLAAGPADESDRLFAGFSWSL